MMKATLVKTIAVFAVVLANAVSASPADPQMLEEVNVSRRMMNELKIAQQNQTNIPSVVTEAMPSIARTILLLGYKTISMERLKKLLKWTSTTDPLFKPRLVPESGELGPTYFVFDRAQNWKLIGNDVVSIELVWTPVISEKHNHFIETQWYRKDGDMWYLFKQDRREIAGCNKWPRCEGDPA
jgi:hypothetical protein